MLIKIYRGFAEYKKDDFTCSGKQYLCWFKGYFYYKSAFYFGKEACLLLEELLLEGRKNTIQEFNGIFLCVLLDESNKIVYIINDRFGFHQLFYYLSDKNAFIGDNFWGIAANSKSVSLDRTSLLEMMQYRFVSGKYTLAENVFCTEPSSIYELNFNDKISLKRNTYWHFQYIPDPISSAEAEDKIYECLNGIITKYNHHLFHDKTIGINLTGGLDTRYIMALLLRNGLEKDHIKCFTYGSPSSDDILLARQVSDSCGTEHFPLLFTDDFEDFFYEVNIDKMLREIGFYSYYFPAYGVLKTVPLYRKVDYLLSGYDGFYLGLKASPDLFSLKDSDSLLNYIYLMNATILDVNDCQSILNYSDNEIKEKLLDRLKENIDPEHNPVSAFFDWTLKNRNRKYLLGVYNLQNVNTTHLLTFYDYDFIDMMASLPFDILHCEKSYINSMFRKAFTNHLEPLARIPVERRGTFQKIEGNFIAPIRSKYTIGNVINKLFNTYDRQYAYPIRQQLRKKKVFHSILTMVGSSVSEHLNNNEVLKLIRKNRKSEYFTRYGMLVLLSILRFENILKKKGS